MEEIGKAAFQLDLKSLKAMRPTNESISGALLSACFAHEPDPKVQEKVISYLLDSGADVNEMDNKLGDSATPRRSIPWPDGGQASTPLHRAVTNTGAPATKGKAEEVERLVQILWAGGAEVWLKNEMGEKSIDYIKDESLLKMFKG